MGPISTNFQVCYHGAMAHYPVVLIDDLRSFVQQRDDALVLRTLDEALGWFETVEAKDTVGQLWLDHDLGKNEAGEIIEIIPFVAQLEERAYFGTAPEIGQVIVHSSNNQRGPKMVVPLSRYFAVQTIAQSDLDNYLVQ